MRALLCYVILFSFPLAANAGWLDKVADIIKEVSDSDTVEDSPSAASLIEAQNADARLPAHWQTFWLDEPVFKGRIFLATAGKTDGPVLLWVHGLGNNGLRDWLPIVPALEKHFRVVMIDLPGFGLSAPPKAKLSPTYYADLLHFIKPYFSPAAITVVGHSLGGAVSLRYAHQYPADIKQLGLIDAAGILHRTAVIKYSATGRIPTNQSMVSEGLLEYAVGAQDLGNAMIEKIVNLPDPTVWLGKSETAWSIALGAYPNINAAMSLVGENYASAAFETSMPVAILWGARDPIAPLRTGEILASTLPINHLTVLDDAKHVPMASHTEAVSQWLLQAFSQPGFWATSPASDENTPDAVAQDYHCENKVGQVLAGVYKTIYLNECTAVLIQDVIAEKIVLRDSVVEINNVIIKGGAIAMDVKDSVAVVTGGEITGEIYLNSARLDIAGTRLVTDMPFMVMAESRIVASICRVGQQRYLHGDILLTEQRF